MTQLTAADPYLWPVLCLLIGAVASMAGGATSAVLIAGKELGVNLAALMGAFFGPLAGVTGIAAGLILLALIG
jgi:hypothetical protein